MVKASTRMPGDSGRMMRRVTQGVFALLVLALPLLAWHYADSQQRLSAELRSLKATQAQLVIGQRVPGRYGQLAEQSEELGVLAEQAQKRGWVADDWEARNVTIENVQVSRKEADVYLGSLGRGPGYFFIANAMNIRAAKSGEGIFKARWDSDEALLFTLKGRYLSRRYE